MKPSFILTLTILFTLALFTSAAAQAVDTSAITDDQVNAIAKQLYCPVCENIPLDVCGTQACAQWRDLIREKLALGWNEEQIKDYFVLQYGDRVLAEPPARGLNWLVYIVPPAAFVAGVFILYRGIQSWRSMSKQQEPELKSNETPANDYISRLEEELRRSDQ